MKRLLNFLIQVLCEFLLSFGVLEHQPVSALGDTKTRWLEESCLHTGLLQLLPHLLEELPLFHYFHREVRENVDEFSLVIQWVLLL